MTKNYQSTWFRVTDQILLEYRSRSKDVTFDGTSSDVQPGKYYIYRGHDDKLYYTEDIRYTAPQATDKSWFLNQSLYQKYPQKQSSKTYSYIPRKNATVDSVMTWQETDVIDFSTIVVNSTKGIQEERPHITSVPNFFYDSVRVYLLSGYTLDGYDGITVKVSGPAVRQLTIEDRMYREEAEVCVFDGYIDKTMLYPSGYTDEGGNAATTASPLHLMEIPLQMNSKFYDKYIEIEFPSLYGIGIRDHNLYDEDGDAVRDNDPTFLVINFNEDGSINPSESEIYSVNYNGSIVVEFGTVSESSEKSYTVAQGKVNGLSFDLDANTVSGNVIPKSNSDYFNARMYTDGDGGDVIYVPMYGENEFDNEVYGQFASGQLTLDANAYYDSQASKEGFNDIDVGGNWSYYQDEAEETGTKLSVFCELLVDYLYYNPDGSVSAYEESYSREIDYARNYQTGVAFWRSRYRPDPNIIELTSASKISLKFTCHLKNKLRGSDTIRTASLLIGTEAYTKNRLTNLNINTYKIVNKIQGQTVEVPVGTQENVREKYIRSYYNATQLTAKNMGTGATVYSQGQMTLALNKTGNTYGIQLFNINEDNVRVPYDLTGTYKYKMVLSTPDGTVSISPNQESEHQSMGIGQLFFYIPGETAQSVMSVPAEQRYFAIKTDLSGKASAQETVLYEGKVDWLS